MYGIDPAAFVAVGQSCLRMQMTLSACECVASHEMEGTYFLCDGPLINESPHFMIVGPSFE